MIKHCLKKWEENKNVLENKLKTSTGLNECEYRDLVELVVRFVLNNDDDGITWDADRITEIDNGDYQGVLLYLIPRDYYQPNESDYLLTYVDYGSCSVCDTLKSIQDYEDGKLTESQVKRFMALCKDLVCNMIKPYNYGWRYDDRFDAVELKDVPGKEGEE